MACWIQIGTCNVTYLVDPYPLFDKISTDLRAIFESKTVLKIMHGCVNDIFTLKRDFATVPVAVVDLQLLHQEIIKTFLTYVGEEEKGKIYDPRGIIQRATGIPNESLPNFEDKVALTKLTKEGLPLSKLVKIHFPQTQEPESATLADWRIRPLTNQKMIDYAVYDVHTLYRVWQSMKILVSATTILFL